MSEFNLLEEKILGKYFTNVKKNIFCLVNLPEVIKGTLFSRYSRSPKSIKRLFIDEFYNGEVREFLKTKTEKTVKTVDYNTEKAEAFYDRVLLGYGDDSVAELGGAHIAIENLSVLATKAIEEHRLGLSPLEKSTRYVYFDQKVNGEYCYYRPEKILKSKYSTEYLNLNNFLFDTYSLIVRELQPILKQVYPGDEKDLAYRVSIRAKACDLARGLLPLSALTNMGLYGNGRAYEYLLVCLLNNELPEIQEIGKEMYTELSFSIKPFIKRVFSERGVEYRKYLTQQNTNLALLSKWNLKKPKPLVDDKVKLIDFDKQALLQILEAILFEKTNLSFKEIKKQLKKMSETQKSKLLMSYLAMRKSRHHKVGRAFEAAEVGLEITADFGVYKDLMRHRILSLSRQSFTNELGFFMPDEIRLSPFKARYLEACERALAFYLKVKKDFPKEAEYSVLHCSYNRFSLKMNLREATHLVELRSIPQGHPSYRKTAQKIAKSIINKLPFCKSVFQFVDYKTYGLERLSTFKKISDKAKKMGVKVFEEN